MNKSNDDDETHWRRDAHENGWELPTPAARWKRLPIIRRLRFAICKSRIEKHYEKTLGTLGAFRSGYDEWVLYAIGRGWC